MRVEFLDSAQDDLEEIYAYIAERDVDSADYLIEKLKTATQRLSRHPLSAPVSEAHGAGVRKLSVHGYVLFYRVTKTAVLISRVIHARRNFWAIDF